MASSSPNRLNEHLPLLAFLAAWSLQIAYFVGYDLRLFYTYGFAVEFMIALTVVSYTVGYLGFRLIPFARIREVRARTWGPLDAKAAKILMRLAVAMAIGLISLNILVPLAQGISLSGARALALDNWETGGVATRVYAILTNVTIAFCLLAIIDFIDVKGKFPFLLTLLFILSTVAAYSRAHLLLGLSIISVKWISQSKYKLSYIFIIFVLFAALFSILSVIASVGSSEKSSGIEDIYKSLEIYTFGGVAGFEFYYTTGIPQYPSLLTVPRFMYSIIPGLGILPPSYFPFIDTTPPINVFSAMYPPYHDYGEYGLVGFFLAYGLLSAAITIAFQRSAGRNLCILAGFSLYAALMSPFDDQFIRGLTVLILMLSGALLYALIYRSIRSGLER